MERTKQDFSKINMTDYLSKHPDPLLQFAMQNKKMEVDYIVELLAIPDELAKYKELMEKNQSKFVSCSRQILQVGEYQWAIFLEATVTKKEELEENKVGEEKENKMEENKDN